tara:strand:- start:37506 stop:37913 length:408 start_codon:yes stop_codon:yes gene_type:complete
MANGINGGLCMIYSGTYASKTSIVGQGDATVTHVGAPIELNNKSSGGWRVNLDGSTSTKSKDIAIDFTVSDDASIQTLITAADNGTVGTYVMDFIDYYYEGSFTPVLSTETAAKDTPVTASFVFQSSGEIVKTDI